MQQKAKNAVVSIAQTIKNLQWIQNLLYQFLQHMTIENADLSTLSLEANTPIEVLEQKQRNLNTLAECLAALLKEVRTKSEQRAVPLALAESAMKVAKGMILGSLSKSI